MKKAARLCLFLLFVMCAKLQAQTVDNVIKSPQELAQSDDHRVRISSEWLSERFADLNNLFRIDQQAPDTIRLIQELDGFAETNRLFQQEIAEVPDGLSIRYLTDLKTEIAALLAKYDDWRKSVGAYTVSLARKSLEFGDAKKTINAFLESIDSSVSNVYQSEANFLFGEIDNGQEFLHSRLVAYTRFHELILRSSNETGQLYSKVLHMLSKNEALLLKEEFLPLWQISPKNYKKGFFEVIGESVRRGTHTAKFYIESSLFKSAMLRFVFFLLLCMPVVIYHQRKRKGIDTPVIKLNFLDKDPLLASVIVGLGLSPIIFTNSPHSIDEVIFLGLTIIVCYFVLKHYKTIDRKRFLSIVIPYFILFILNFFVTPTFIGRIIFSLSIFILIPLIRDYKSVNTYDTKYKGFIRFLIVFLIAHIIIGWVLVVYGRFTLGKSVILAAYNLLILSMILRISVMTAQDYIAIVGQMINERSQAIHVNYREFLKVIQPFLFLFSVLILLISYLSNLNILELSRGMLTKILERPRYISNFEFSYESLLLFFGSVYFAFVLANVLRATFDQSGLQNSGEKRTKFGSYILLFRLLIITAGFFGAILLSGIPINTFTIIFGALSVGIGFGLQNFVSNILSGLFIAFERPFILGDILEFDNDSGRIKEIGLRATRMTTNDGADVIIPNGALLSKRLKNWTYSNNHKTLEILIPVDHSEDHVKVLALISRAIKEQPGLLNNINNPVVLHDITDKSTIYKTQITIENLNAAVKVRGDFMNRVYTLFREGDIKFPLHQSNY